MTVPIELDHTVPPAYVGQSLNETSLSTEVHVCHDTDPSVENDALAPTRTPLPGDAPIKLYKGQTQLLTIWWL